MQDDAERPHVGARGGGISHHHLGSHVARCPHHDGVAMSTAGIGGQTEVAHHQAAIFHTQQVLGLDVTVDDPGRVQGCGALHHRARVSHSIGEWSDRGGHSQLFPNRSPGGQLHRQESVSLGRTDVEDSNYIAMLNLTSHPELA